MLRPVLVPAAPPPLPPWLAAGYSPPRRTHVLGRGRDAGRRLHVVDAGPGASGAPLVWLQHGNPTWSFLWRRVLALLPDLRCVAPDLLGFGLSDKLPRASDHGLERHADALADLFDALDPARVVLVGQDWGGPLVCALGARRPERVAGLVLGNTSVLAPARPRGTAFHRFAATPVVSDLAFRGLGFPLGALHRAQGDPASIAGDVARAYRWPLRRRADRAGPLGLARMVPTRADHPSLPALRAGEAWARAFAGPAALVWGERDPILGRALARHREALPAAAVTTTAAGHFLQEEVPEAIAAAIRDVLARA